MSLPRDLKVQIPGHGTDKINAAYELGGPAAHAQDGEAAHRPVDQPRDQRGLPGLPEGDRRDRLHLRRHRPHATSTTARATRTSTCQAGYQKLCGEEALEYARFRHEDSDLVRGVRQQDLLREAKQQVGVSKLVDDRDKLIEIFGKYTTSDAELKTRSGILRLLKLAVFSVDQPIREVHFEGQITGGEVGGAQLRDRQQRDGQEAHAPVPRRRGDRGPARRAAAQGRRQAQAGQAPAGRRRPGEGARARARTRRSRRSRPGAGGQLPVYYPTVRDQGLDFAGPPRYYQHRDPGRQAPQELPDGHQARARRRVLRRPGHHLEGAADPRRARPRSARSASAPSSSTTTAIACAWWPGAPSKAVYWVSNTLLQTLTERQMLAIARSTRLP